MIRIIKNLYRAFNIEDKKKLLLISLFLLFSVIFESLSIGILIPVFKLILDPNQSLQFLTGNLSFIGSYLKPENYAYLLLCSVFIIFVIKFIVILSLTYLQYNFGFYLHNRLTKKILGKVTNLNLENFYKTHTSKATTIFATEVDQFVGCTVALLVFINEILVISALVVIMFLLNFKFTSVLLLIFLLSFFIYILFLKKIIINLGIKRSKYEGLKFRTLLEYFNNYFEINIYDKIKLFQNRFIESSVERNHSFKWIRFYQNLPRVFFEFYVLIIFVLTAIYIKILDINFEDIFIIGGIYAVCAFRIIPSFNKTMQSTQTLKFLKPAIKNINDVLKIEHKKIKSIKIKLKDKIELKNFSFKYQNTEKIIFKDCNLKIYKKDLIAIKGESGSGKSTLINIILGYLKPNRGNIYIDDKKFLKNQTFKFNVGYVPQTPTLLDENLKENILFGRDYDRDRFEKIVSTCNLKKFNKSNSKIKNRELGERGKSVSGGQRQRIMIARALYDDPEIIIFDEFSSSLDSENEEKILLNLKKILKNKTVIFITHSKKVENFCKKVYLIDNNKIKKIK